MRPLDRLLPAFRLTATGAYEDTDIAISSVGFARVPRAQLACERRLRVLVVEDNPVDARMIEQWLERAPCPAGIQYSARVTRSLREALEALQGETFDAIVLDLVLPDCAREETLPRIRAASTAPIVVLSSVHEESVALELLRAGAQDYLLKGKVDPDRLQRSIRYALERYELEQKLRRQNQALRALSECNHVVAQARSESELFSEVCKVVVRRGGYRFAWIGLVEEGCPPRVEPYAWDGYAATYLNDLCVTLDDSPTGQHPAAWALRSGRAQTVPDVGRHPDSGPWRVRAEEYGYRSIIALPIRVGERDSGVFCVYSAEVDAFGYDAASLLEELASNLAVGIERLRAEAERARAEAERRLAESRFRLLAEVSPVGVLYGMADGSCVYVNDRACQLLGHKREELLGLQWQEFLVEEDRQRLWNELQLWPGTGVGSTDFRFRRGDGQIIWISLQFSLVRHAHGGLVFVGTITDVTARRQAEEAVERLTRRLEQMVAERTKELEHALRELEAFNHSLAHDIRAPLRRVVAYCELLKIRCGEQLPEQARRYVQLVRANAAHLDRLVDDLINLARVRTHPLRCREVNVSVVAEEILRSLQEAEPYRVVDWWVAPELYVWADPHLMEIALSNLLENAWKYTRVRESARIEVGVVRSGTEAGFFVRDNGCGFDPKDTERLFAPFTRLHSAEEFEGTGIGLATVHRIVARHNGKLRAEGQLNQGATFYVVLPPRPKSTE